MKLAPCSGVDALLRNAFIDRRSCTRELHLRVELACDDYSYTLLGTRLRTTAYEMLYDTCFRGVGKTTA